MKYPKRSQYKYAKSPYRIRNWPEYEAGLRRRGDLTIWLSDAALDTWQAPPSGKTGGQRTYADIAVEAALTIRMLFHLPLRQTEASCVPWQTCLRWRSSFPTTRRCPGGSRRSVTSRFVRSRAIDRSICSSIIDTMGLRIHVGPLRKPPKRRAWRKLHVAVDSETGEIVASDLTSRRTPDCTRVPP